MAQSLTNQVDISGEYGDPASAINFSSNAVTTTIVEGLTVTKTADKTNWVDGPLTYTVVIDNNSGSSMSNGTLTDKIDTTLVDFNTTYGVQLNGSSHTSFTYESGTLSITLPALDDGAKQQSYSKLHEKVSSIATIINIKRFLLCLLLHPIKNHHSVGDFLFKTTH